MNLNPQTFQAETIARAPSAAWEPVPGIPRMQHLFLLFLSSVVESARAKAVVRALMFLYIALILCPVQYWPFVDKADNSWYFAVNYAAVHHLVPGRDIVSTSGPLGYLAIPQDIGNNLAKGLVFQTALWALVLAIVWGLFYRSKIPLRNLIFFTAFMGLSAKVYQYPDALGSADLVLAGAIILLVRFQMHGGLWRYVAALLMLGFVPLIRFVGLFTVAGVIAGVIADRIVHWRKGTGRELLLALAVPISVVGTGYRLSMGSFDVVADYLRSSIELSRGYSEAMSLAGPRVEFLAALEAFLLLVIALGFLARSDRRMAVFFALLLAVPLIVNTKHGFVRQDSAHIMHFFCFIAFALALLALATSLQKRAAATSFGVILLLLGTLWQDNVARDDFQAAVAAVTGIKTPYMIWPVLPFGGGLRNHLKMETDDQFPPGERVEPEIRSIVGLEPVASLSPAYSDMVIDGLNPALYPVVLRYSACTPYLDKLNADWVRDKGARFLIFNAQSIHDGRHPWTETPAMWVEIYRWYNLRFLGTRNLLLERRKVQRFTRFELVKREQVRWGEDLRPPASPGAIFWSLQCSLTTSGKLRKLLFRVPEVTLALSEGTGREASFRMLPAVTLSPSMGNYLPSSLAEFAVVFGPEPPNFRIEKLRSGGPGASAYASTCELQWLRLE